MTRRIGKIGLVACACAASIASAQSFTLVGDLGGGSVRSNGYAASNNGSYVAGSSFSSANYEGFFWSSSTGIVGTGFLPFTGSKISVAWGVSDTGVVVGQSRSNNTTTTSEYQAFHWTLAGGMVGLEDLPGGDFYSIARAVTPNGAVIAGFSFGLTDSGVTTALPVRWVNGVVSPLGTLDPDGGGSAYAVSDDGTTIVGSATPAGFGTSNSASWPFVWTASGGIVPMGTAPVPNGSTTPLNNFAYGVSGNGQYATGMLTNKAFRWDAATNTNMLLGGLDHKAASGGRDVTNDGSIVVGIATNANPSTLTPTALAFIWDTEHGMRSLTDVAIAAGVPIPDGYTLVDCVRVTEDGLTFAGTAYSSIGQVYIGYVMTFPVPVPSGACCVAQVCSVKTTADCTTAGGVYKGNHTTCAGNTCCPADFNDDSVRDVADLFGYINAWLAKAGTADFNHDSTVDVADLFGYINAWLAGC